MKSTWDSIRNFFKSRSRQTHPPEPKLELSDLKTLNIDWLIIGLGNPGAKYAATRHNVGYMALDDLLAREGDILESVRGYRVDAAPLHFDNQHALALRSKNFMNLSGTDVAALAQQLGIKPERIVVLHDELDLPPGKIRLRKGGNENGHNGLKSLTQCLGSRDYLRVRIGIGRPPKGSSIPDYVLGPVSGGAGFDEAITTAAEAAELVVREGLAVAQNRIHSRK